jgi:hypothetical protein
MPTKPDIKIKYSQQEILNMSFDEVLRTLVFQPIDTPLAVKVTESGTTTYVAYAPTGSLQSDAVWQARKVDESSGTVITWADGGNYTQVATDLTALTYS